LCVHNWCVHGWMLYGLDLLFLFMVREWRTL
jgi:hypothetical protein